MTSVNKVVVSDKVLCNNRKNLQHIAGSQQDWQAVILLFIKTTMTIFSYGVFQYNRNSAYTMPCKVSQLPGSLLHYRNIWVEVQLQLREKRTTDPIRREGKYMHSFLEMQEEQIKTNSQHQNVLCGMYWNELALLNIEPVCKQSKNRHPQV